MNFLPAWRPRRLMLVCALATALVSAAARTVMAQTPALAWPQGAVDLGPVEAGTAVQTTVYFRPDAARQSALTEFLSEVEAPGSAVYHEWLTPAQFAAEFGAPADQVARVRAFVENAGLRVVSVSGLRMVVAGTDTEVEAAFAPGLEQVRVGGQAFVAAAAKPVVPQALNADVMAIGGMTTLPGAHPLTLAADGSAIEPSGYGALEDLAGAVEADNAHVLAVSGTACASEFGDAQQQAMEGVLREAEAQGITVLAQSGCASAGDTSFPAALPEVTAVAVAPGVSGETGVLAGEVRPAWQDAPGLPTDGLRHEPDVTVSSLAALAQAFDTIEEQASSTARVPDSGLGAPGAPGTDTALNTLPRLGNVDATLYELAPVAGLYTQPDAAATGEVGNWETATGLGVVDLQKLIKAYPMGVLTSSVSVAASSYSVTHGQPITITSTVKDISGQGNGVVPTGTVTWSLSSGTTLGPVSLTNGTASVTTNQLPANSSYTVTAQYSGDGTYAPATASTTFTILPEAAVVSAQAGPAVALGQAASVVVTVTSKSGVGTPTGQASVVPQGTSDTNTYTAALTGSNGTATGTVTFKPVQAGSVTVLANCISTNASFTCYSPVSATVSVTPGQSATQLTIFVPVGGGEVSYSVSVLGAGTGFPVPTGNVTFYDNGQNVGSATLTVEQTFASAGFVEKASTSGSHLYTAQYGGDNNYAASTSPQVGTGTAATTLALGVSPNPPVSGSTTTLSATVGYTAVSGTTPSGQISFYEDGTLLGMENVSVSGSTVGATYTSTALSGTAAHNFVADYSGDTNYEGAQSNTVATQASGTTSTGTTATTTTLKIAPNPPVNGSTTTFTATIGYTANGTTTPTGTVAFYEDSVQIGSASISSGSSAVTATFTSTTISGTAAHSFYAVYQGDTNFAGSTSATVSSTAEAANTTATTVTASPNSVAVGGTVTLTATVTPATTDGTEPTGNVTFSTSSSQGSLGTAPLNGSGVATLQTQLTVAGSQTISASYAGDSNWASSASASPAAVAVGAASSTTPAITLTVAPPRVSTGATVTLSSTVSGSTTSGSTTGPTGTVTFTLTPNNGGTATTTSATLTGTTSNLTATTATTTMTAPAAGTYTVTATCTGTNISCTGLTASAALVVTQATDTLTLSAAPNPPVTGEPETLTATINSTASCTGTVEFFVNGANVGSAAVNGDVAIYTLTLPALNNTAYAMYLGDTNCPASTSSVTTLDVQPATTSGTLLTGEGTALQGASVTLTALFTTQATTYDPYPAAPSGSVTFYTSLNGISRVLGTVSLVANGASSSIAVFTTTGLQDGANVITASYAGSTSFAASTAGPQTVDVDDFSVAFSPPNATTTAGQAVTALVTVVPVDGFAGEVALNCAPPVNSEATCAISPSTVSNGGGVAAMSITTTAPTSTNAAASLGKGKGDTGIAGGASLAVAMLALLWPGSRRRRGWVSLVAVFAVSLVLLSSMGCGQQTYTVTPGGGGSGTTGGTPSGTLLFTVTASGTDGQTTNLHSYQYQVTVQ